MYLFTHPEKMNSFKGFMEVCFLSAIVFGLIIAIPNIISIYKRKLNTDSFKIKYGTLTEGIDTDWLFSRYYYSYIVFRRLLMALTLLVPCVQIQINSYISLFFAGFICTRTPFANPDSNTLDFFNEMTIYTNFLLSFCSSGGP